MENEMKNTIQSIVGQESGFVLFPNYNGRERACLENWSSNLEEYTCDLRKTRKVKNCLAYLEAYNGRDDDGDLKYVENANPVTDDEIATPGTLYDFGDFLVLAPRGWS